MLEIFALIILLVLLTAAVVLWAVIGMLPGRIARARNHPQADAITVCGWWGVITMGLLCPLAFIWAYTKQTPAVAETRQATDRSRDASL
jgi:hypothetical protein